MYQVSTVILHDIVLWDEVQGTLYSPINGLRYIDRDIKNQASFTEKAVEYLPNRLTLLYFKTYYEEENYLKVKTKLFIYPSPYSKGLSTLVYQYISILCFFVLVYLHTKFYYITQLPLILQFYWFYQSRIPRTDSNPI